MAIFCLQQWVHCHSGIHTRSQKRGQGQHSSFHDHMVLFYMCTDPPSGYLKTVDSVVLPLYKSYNAVVIPHRIYSKEAKNDSKRVYDDVINDHTEDIIDNLIVLQDTIPDMDKTSGLDDYESPSVEYIHTVNGLAHLEQDDDIVYYQAITSDHIRHLASCSNFHFELKTRGHLVHQATKF